MRIGINLDKEVVEQIDVVRGLIPRSRFVNATLAQKARQIKESGDTLGHV